MMPEAERLSIVLRSAVKRVMGGRERAAIMFSGGLDSAILAVTARKHCAPTLYTLGMEGSHDLVWGKECAEILDLPFVGIVFGKEDVIASIERVVHTHGMDNPKWMATFVSFDIILGHVREDVVVCGQGADELFGGYRKYLSGPEPEARMAADTAELLAHEWPAYGSMAANHGKTLLAPYLDGKVVEFAAALPIGSKMGECGNKLILREAANLLGVPGMMANRPKKAMQYGSGVSKLMKRYLKESGIDLKR